MTNYVTSTAAIAARLRALADRFDTLPATFPEARLSLDVHLASSAPEEDRAAAVSALCTGLLDTEAKMSSGGKIFGTSVLGVERDGVSVEVFTVVELDRERALRVENERLRAQAAAAEKWYREHGVAGPPVAQS